jgi:hypothetical protein
LRRSDTDADSRHADPGDTDSGDTNTDAGHADSGDTDADSRYADAGHADSGDTDADSRHADAGHADSGDTDADSRHADSDHGDSHPNTFAFANPSTRARCNSSTGCRRSWTGVLRQAPDSQEPEDETNELKLNRTSTSGEDIWQGWRAERSRRNS